MAGLLLEESDGFSFDLYQRNEHLFNVNKIAPRAIKTGTTIVGIMVKDAAILGADTRATSGTLIAEKNCAKIHYLADNMYACGAGTAADTDHVGRLLSSRLELHRLSTGKRVPVIAATRMMRQHLYRYQGHIGAAMIVGGFDDNGPVIYSIHPHGSIDKSQYTASGSGCLAAMAVLEQGWKPDLTVEEGTKLVRDAIAAGIFNDLGSGNRINLCVIKDNDVQYMRPYEEPVRAGQKLKSYKFESGTTAIISQSVIPLKLENMIARQLEAAEPMDTQ